MANLDRNNGQVLDEAKGKRGMMTQRKIWRIIISIIGLVLIGNIVSTMPFNSEIWAALLPAIVAIILLFACTYVNDSEKIVSSSHKNIIASNSNKIPPTDKISEIVKTILVFMPDIETAKKVVEEMQAKNKNNINIIVKGDNTKQGRYMLNMEGDIPKDYALVILQIVDNYNGSIEIVVGK